MLKFIKSKKVSLGNKGFTLLELLVSIFIFIFLTTLLVVKYGNFDQSVLFTNLAYDVALTLRTAQTYGLSVQGQESNFKYPYGVSFCALATGCEPEAMDIEKSKLIGFNNQKMFLFADTNICGGSSSCTGGFDEDDIVISSYNIKRSVKIYGMCITSGCGSPDNTKRVDITFVRPNPDAIICVSNDLHENDCVGKNAANGPRSSVRIFFRSPNGGLRTIIIRNTGQISVEEL